MCDGRTDEQVIGDGPVCYGKDGRSDIVAQIHAPCNDGLGGGVGDRDTGRSKFPKGRRCRVAGAAVAAQGAAAIKVQAAGQVPDVLLARHGFDKATIEVQCRDTVSAPAKCASAALELHRARRIHGQCAQNDTRAVAGHIIEDQRTGIHCGATGEGALCRKRQRAGTGFGQAARAGNGTRNLRGRARINRQVAEIGNRRMEVDAARTAVDAEFAQGRVVGGGSEAHNDRACIGIGHPVAIGSAALTRDACYGVVVGALTISYRAARDA